jgi:hypothetical protein
MASTPAHKRFNSAVMPSTFSLRTEVGVRSRASWPASRSFPFDICFPFASSLLNQVETRPANAVMRRPLRNRIPTGDAASTLTSGFLPGKMYSSALTSSARVWAMPCGPNRFATCTHGAVGLPKRSCARPLQHRSNILLDPCASCDGMLSEMPNQRLTKHLGRTRSSPDLTRPAFMF